MTCPISNPGIMGLPPVFVCPTRLARRHGWGHETSTRNEYRTIRVENKELLGFVSQNQHTAAKLARLVSGAHQMSLMPGSGATSRREAMVNTSTLDLAFEALLARRPPCGPKARHGNLEISRRNRSQELCLAFESAKRPVRRRARMNGTSFTHRLKPERSRALVRVPLCVPVAIAPTD